MAEGRKLSLWRTEEQSIFGGLPELGSVKYIWAFWLILRATHSCAGIAGQSSNEHCQHHYIEPQNHPTVFRDCAFFFFSFFLYQSYMFHESQLHSRITSACRENKSVVLVKPGFSLQVQKQYHSLVVNTFWTKLLKISSVKKVHTSEDELFHIWP